MNLQKIPIAAKEKLFQFRNLLFGTIMKKNTKENIGRSMIVSREVWLSMPYNRKYWNKAIEEYNKRWLKNE